MNSCNPWQRLYWLVAGRSIGGTLLCPEARRLDPLTALGLMTANGAWFSRDTGRKGLLKPGALVTWRCWTATISACPKTRSRTSCRC